MYFSIMVMVEIYHVFLCVLINKSYFLQFYSFAKTQTVNFEGLRNKFLCGFVAFLQFYRGRAGSKTPPAVEFLAVVQRRSFLLLLCLNGKKWKKRGFFALLAIEGEKGRGVASANEKRGLKVVALVIRNGSGRKTVASLLAPVGPPDPKSAHSV